jgi:hypothetical protein
VCCHNTQGDREISLGVVYTAWTEVTPYSGAEKPAHKHRINIVARTRRASRAMTHVEDPSPTFLHGDNCMNELPESHFFLAHPPPLSFLATYNFSEERPFKEAKLRTA